MEAILVLLIVATVSASDRTHIRRPTISIEAAVPPVVDNGFNYGCIPDRSLVEACVVRHQKDTKEVLF